MLATLNIHDGPVPLDDPALSGKLLAVWLKAERDDGFEYHGDPVIVRYYGHKLKTTLHPMRLDIDDVVRWAAWE